MGKKQRAPRQPVAQEPVATWPSGYEIAGHEKPPGPDAINREVAFFKAQFDAKPNYLSVLRALEHVAVARMQGIQWTPHGQFFDLAPVQPDGTVMLPWWAVSALIGAVQEARRKNLPLDKVMGLSGARRGKRGMFAESDTFAEHAARAVEVAFLMQRDGIGKMRAVEEVAGRYGITDKAVLDSINKAESQGRLPLLKRTDQSDSN